ncbi:ShlB/FhaC/HecB family hemolysin secretion/activation protein [Bradyrhizobium sp. STM 3557]|uniref:ShlB/FhaC/HecB family hemolysin secretion/activation protein n=1 Tax=Bradyrhizobium sp. STM 3557 TaxID=578920 RepID=UPI00388E8A11
MASLVFSAILVQPLAVPLARAEQVTQPTFNTRQTEKYFDDLQAQRGPAPPLSMPPVGAAEGARSGKPLFVLRSVVLTGATSLDNAELAAAYQPFLGKPVSQADLAGIANAISDRYRAAGYHLSRAIVPPQDIENGRVRIQVIEGSIAEVSLKGEGAEEFGIRPMLDPVLAEQPSRFATLERQLLLINGRAGVRITDSAMEEVGGTTGRFRLVLQVQAWHVYGFAGVNNLGASTVGPWQSYATAAFNSYLTPGDALAVNLSTTPGDVRELSFVRLSYDTPVGTGGARVGASALYSEVRPGDFRRLYNDNTVTEAVEVHGSITPIQTQHASLVLTVAAGFLNATERSVFGTLYEDHVRTLTLTSDYHWDDRLAGDNFLTVSYRQGLDIFGAGSPDGLSSRDGASPNFSVVNAWFTRYQSLAAGWSIKLAGAAQFASGVLFTSQQFYLGGFAFGRGYGSAEVSGDNGLAGTFELRYDQAVNWAYLAGYQLYSFVDAGLAWNDGYRPWEGIALTSAGAGVRFTFANDLHADFSVAFPLSYRAPDNDTRSARFLVSLSTALKLCPQRGQGHCL